MVGALQALGDLVVEWRLRPRLRILQRLEDRLSHREPFHHLRVAVRLLGSRRVAGEEHVLGPALRRGDAGGRLHGLVWVLGEGTDAERDAAERRRGVLALDRLWVDGPAEVLYEGGIERAGVHLAGGRLPDVRPVDHEPAA